MGVAGARQGEVVPLADMGQEVTGEAMPEPQAPVIKPPRRRSRRAPSVEEAAGEVPGGPFPTAPPRVG